MYINKYITFLGNRFNVVMIMDNNVVRIFCENEFIF